MTTPDVHIDLATKTTALVPASFPAAQTFTLAEKPPGGEVTESSTWIKFVSEIAEPYDETGAIHTQTFQFKRRVDRVNDPKGADALTAMVALHDALRGSGGLGATTINGHAYIDVRARTFPRLLEELYVVMDVDAVFDQVSV